MSQNPSQGQFTELQIHERDAVMSELAKTGEFLTVWVKASASKSFFKCKGFAPHSSLLELIPRETGQFLHLDKKEVMVSFFLKSLQFFFTGVFSIDKTNQTYLVKISDKLFKFERRKNFRLLTYPIHAVRFHFKFPEKLVKPSNVISLRAKGEQTKLFQKFLELVNDQTDSKKNYEANFRVQDLSTTGLSFIMGELESRYIDENMILEKSLLEFNDKKYIIPQATVVYIMNYIDPVKAGVKFFKVGIAFKNLDLALDNELSIHINKEIRESDSNRIFEDFLK